jgi:signal transduction histidine kinase
VAHAERPSGLKSALASGFWTALPRSGLAVRVAAVAVVYAVAAKFGLSLAFETQQVTAVWPPTGIALAALLVFGWRLWPGIFAGAVVANITSSEAAVTAVGIAIGNTAAALIGWYALCRIVAFDEALRRVRDVAALVVVAALTPLVSASNGVATLALHGTVPWSAFWEVWRTWWVGDALGILLVCPLLLTWVRHPRPTAAPEKPVELGILSAACLAVSLVTLAGVLIAPSTHHLAYPVFPLIIWAALRWGPREAATLVVLVSAVAVWGAIHGRGPFAHGSVDERLVLLDLFMAVVALTALVLSAATAERRDVQARLQRSEERRQSLLAAILNAEEEARQHIAVELHDDTIQVLTAALVDLDSCAAAIDQEDYARARDRFGRVRDTVSDAVNRVRRLTFELRPPVLETHGVGAALNQLIDAATEELGIQVERKIHLRRYAPEIEILVFRTTRELVANVRKHAHASRLMVEVVEGDRVIRGTVIDDGRGFDVAAALDRTKARYNLGLDATIERLRVLGGKLDFDSTREGTTAGFTVPLQRADDLRPQAAPAPAEITPVEARI